MNIAEQFYLPSPLPLDQSARVATLANLNDPDYVVPYVGKLVHVQETQTIYICASVKKVNRVLVGTWRPALAEDGSALYLTTNGVDGEADQVYQISVQKDEQQVPRITVKLGSSLPGIYPPPTND